MRFWVCVMLRLFPRRFRRRFGPDLLATFDERWNERAGLPLAARTIGDMVRSAAIERLKGDGVIRTLRQDIHIGVRGLMKSPGFAVPALLTLALGVGATAAIYSVVNSVLFKGLPYPHADRLVFINESLPKASALNVSWPDYQDWKAQNQVFDRMMVFQPNSMSIASVDGMKTEPVGWVSSSFFPVVGARPIVGRTFSETDDKPGASPVAVLSYRFWRNDLKGDPDVTGRQIDTPNGAFTIVGVLGPDFQILPWEFDVYLPIGLRANNPDFVARQNHPNLQVIAAMRDGVTLARVRDDMKTIMARLATSYPASNRDETAAVVPLADRLIGTVRSDLLMLLGAVIFVLLIACVNVAHLSLARAAHRQGEFAIRAAIGANKVRLVCQVFTESVILAIAGGAAGLVLARWGLPLLTRMYPQSVPGLKDAALDTNVFLFTMGLCLAAACIFGLAPMLQAARSGLNVPSRSGGAGPHGRKVRAFLFVAEIAIAIAVTVGAGLLLRSLAAVMNVNPGFRADHLLALDVIRSGKSGLSDLQFFEQAVEEIAQKPGVESASAAMCPPLSGTCWTSPVMAEGQKDVPDIQKPWTALNMVTPGYFQTAGIQLLEGRLFDAHDNAQSRQVAIVNESFAQRFWPRGQAVGKHLDIVFVGARGLEVAGVIADIKQFSLEAPAMPEVYLPVAQKPVSFMTIMVRTSVEPENLTKVATDAIRSMDKNQTVARVTPLMKRIAALAARRRFAALLLSLFSAAALMLAAIGVSGVMAYTVAQRTREFGIRVAVGAQRRAIVQLVLKEGMFLTALGVAIGSAGSWGLARSIQSMLFGIKPHDALTFISVPALLAVVALLGCWLPARRAARVNPIEALRHD
jgi:putative ABC transport system permease protein